MASIKDSAISASISISRLYLWISYIILFDLWPGTTLWLNAFLGMTTSAWQPHSDKISNMEAVMWINYTRGRQRRFLLSSYRKLLHVTLTILCITQDLNLWRPSQTDVHATFQNIVFNKWIELNNNNYLIIHYQIDSLIANKFNTLKKKTKEGMRQVLNLASHEPQTFRDRIFIRLQFLYHLSSWHYICTDQPDFSDRFLNFSPILLPLPLCVNSRERYNIIDF